MPNARITIVPPAGTPFVNPAFAPLCRRFEPLAAFALKAASGKGARDLSWDDCQARLDALADEEQALPVPEDMLPEDMAACRMACYTLVDELLNASPRPGEAVPGWAARSMQARRLGTSTGGADFFARLEDLLGRAFDETPDLPGGEFFGIVGVIIRGAVAQIVDRFPEADIVFGNDIEAVPRNKYLFIMRAVSVDHRGPEPENIDQISDPDQQKRQKDRENDPVLVAVHRVKGVSHERKYDQRGQQGRQGKVEKTMFFHQITS